jgi:hypothetical protein
MSIVDKIEKIIKKNIIKSLSINGNDTKGNKRGYDIEKNIDNVMKNIVGLLFLIFGIYVMNSNSFNLGLIFCILGIIIMGFNSYWKNIIKN